MSTAEQAPPSRTPLTAWIVPAVFGLLLVGGLIAVLVLARQAAKPDAPPEPGAFVPPATAHPSAAFDVQRVDGGTLTVTGNSKDSQQMTLPATARVEILDAIAPADLHPGDWLTVVGVSNEVKSFGIRSIVVVSSPGSPDADGIVRTPAGFAGNEASRDPKELPILGGTVTRADSLSATLQTASGPITISFAGAPPLRKVRAGSLADVHEGDRLSFLTAGGAPNLGAALVLPGGAR